MECKALLEELRSQLPKLQVRYEENSTLVELRQVLVPFRTCHSRNSPLTFFAPRPFLHTTMTWPEWQDMYKLSQELEQWKNDYQVQSSRVVRLEQQLASTKVETVCGEVIPAMASPLSDGRF